MQYNLYISCKSGKYNLFGLTSHKLQKVIDAYLNGDKSITLSGTKFTLDEVSSLKIYQHEIEQSPQEASEYYLENINYRVRDFYHYYLPPKTMQMMGKEVTELFIQDKEYGENNLLKKHSQSPQVSPYIDLLRIKDLKKLPNTKFDFTKLIKLCEELNYNYAEGNYLSAGMIGRTILNHIPPVFGLNTFEEVTSSYGGPKDNKSFKKSMKHLNDSLKNIADSYLHLKIRKQEELPNETQINFKQDIDVLLSEIIRVSK